ncbi:hypothetical protein N6L27_03420 [Leisingera sp. SS27]|uniref:hypothetical protein n=1 Tax=Leisingera sp. SS27 TaxID=2979462 RepID=UPI00232E135A|nr:hypothetical protein [Leisingera sp. SS27]MDC0657040.1 hypothetical protein [Leisingera sp. SS27]
MPILSGEALSFRAVDSNGDPVSGALLKLYIAGTTTQATAYTDAGLTTAHPWPLVANAAGIFDTIYAADGGYKVDIQDPDGASLPGFPQEVVTSQSAAAVSTFNTRAEAEAAIVLAVVFKIALINNGRVLEYYRDASGTALTTGDGATWSPAGRAYVTHWAANTTPGTTDIGAGVAAAVNWAKANGRIVFVPEGRHYCGTTTIDCGLAVGSTVKWGFEGEDRAASILITGIDDHSRDFIQVKSPNSAERCGGTPSIGNFRIERNSSGDRQPIFLHTYGVSNARLLPMSFAGSNNSHARHEVLYNYRINDIQSYFGGRHYLYKATDGIEFDITSGTTTLTSTSAVFAAGDVGKTIRLTRDDGTGEKFVIASFTSTTEVEVTANADYTFDSGTQTVVGTFEHARCAMTASSATLTANASVFSAEDVGLYVYVEGAGASGKVLASQISAYVSATEVTLADNASTTVSDAVFYTPCIDIASNPDYSGISASRPETNDLVIERLHVENYAGVGLGVNIATDFIILDSKIHAEAQPVDERSSLYSIAGADWKGSFTGILAADTVGRGGKCLWMDQNGVLNLPYTRQYLSSGEPLCTLGNFQSGGFVYYGRTDLIGDISQGTFDGVLDGLSTTDRRVFVDVLTATDIAPTEMPAQTVAGNFKGWTEGGTGTVTLAGTTTDGDYSYSSQALDWTRFGDVVFFQIRIVVSAINTAATGNMVIKGLPYVAASATQGGAYLSNWRWDLTTTGAHPTGHINAGETQIRLLECVDNTAPAAMVPGGVLANTSMTVSGHYKIKLT